MEFIDLQDLARQLGAVGKVEIKKPQKEEIDDIATSTASPQPTPPENPGALTDIPKPGALSADNRLRTYATCAPLKPLLPGLDDLVHIWNFIYPDFTLYDWQEQELLRISGYVNGTRSGPRVDYTPQNPLIVGYRCPNGSGKDMTINAASAMGLPLLYPKFYSVVTSSSHDQLKYQTELHIANAIRALNSKLPTPVYDSISFYHKIKDGSHGGEIKLFATDEAGRAEGWHPLDPTGRLGLLVNEAKTIDPAIFTALDRCWGYSHWMEVSSPGGHSGPFYDNVSAAEESGNHFPQAVKPNTYWTRHITWRDCPHITPEHYQRLVLKHGVGSFFVETSLEANFHEPTADVIFHRSTFINAGWRAMSDYDDIGIGLDSAAGGDETTLYVRAGGRLIYSHCYRQADTEDSADIIDNDLFRWKTANYIFRADDGGISHGIVDKLSRRGWHIQRVLNNQRALKPAVYKDRGAELWCEVARMLELGIIQLPTDPILREQLATRKGDQVRNGGKWALESKKDMKLRGLSSPDRADGYILCFSSFTAGANEILNPEPLPLRRRMHIDTFMALANNDPDFVSKLIKQHDGQKSAKNIYSLYELSKSR